MKSTFLFLLSLRIFIFILTWLKEKAFKKIKSLLQTFYRVSQKWLWSYDLWLLWVNSRVYTVLYMDVSQKTIGKDRTEKGASLLKLLVEEWRTRKSRSIFEAPGFWWRKRGQEKVDQYLFWRKRKTKLFQYLIYQVQAKYFLHLQRKTSGKE